MNIIRLALRNPVAVIVSVLAIVYFSIISITRINVDIFPKVEAPAVYIAMPYGGLSPFYMDGFMANQFQRVLVFVGGVKNMEFKSVQGMSLMKLSFYPGTDMAEAQAQLATQVSRAMAFLPPGAVPPQVVRFDASAQPIGRLVFESPSRSISEIQNFVITRIRPSFVTIPGISAPAPFGGNSRSMVINVDPDKMQALGLTSEDVLYALTQNNFPSPAGNVVIGDVNYMSPVNTLERGSEEFMNTPITTRNGTTIFMRDIAGVRLSSDKVTGYAMVNGQRSVYLPVIKKAGASTLEAINNLKAAMPQLREILPEDVKVEFAFDQSTYVENALTNLVHEGILGAILTGLMVLLFLGDRRGALIVIVTIPIAILSAVIMLYLLGFSINIMTLSGLALAIGILVDEATVTIENIHQHMDMDKDKPRAILDALLEISLPKLLILLSILAVLLPSFMMTGVPKDMFMPLSVAVGSAMIASYLASQTFVPVIANWFMKHKEKKEAKKESGFERFKAKYLNFVAGLRSYKMGIFIGFIVFVFFLVGLLFSGIGTDILPPSESRDIQLRIAAPEGTKLDVTEDYVIAVENAIKEYISPDKITISSAYVGMQSPNTPINLIFLFTSGSHEAVLQFTLAKSFSQPIADFKAGMRKELHARFPELEFSFEPMSLTEKILGQGYTTPISIEVLGRNLDQVEIYAEKVVNQLKELDFLADVRIKEPLNYPTINIHIDRERAAQLGLSMKDISAVLTTATSSSRFVKKNMWIHPTSGMVIQVQMQLNESDINTLNALRRLPLSDGIHSPVLADVTDLKIGSQAGQVNRKGPNRYVTVSANIHDIDLGTASSIVAQVLENMEQPPRGYQVNMVGKVEILQGTLSGLKSGLLIAIVVIFLMLTAYYQSFKTSLVIMSVSPAVLAGSLLSLTLLGNTLNLQSYMGMIMAVGVSISNAVLLIDQAEIARKKDLYSAYEAAMKALKTRFRPILMTTIAMVAGMIPMALGFGEGGEQVAPLGRAVIGGLLFSTLTSLLVLPFIYQVAFAKSEPKKVSLDPDDINSKFYINA